MKIMVNVQSLLKNKLEGFGRFTCETMKLITTQHPDDSFIFVFDRSFDSQFIFSDNIVPIVLNPPNRHPFIWHFRFEHLYPSLIYKYQPDVFVTTDGWMPLRCKANSVAVMHDINFEHYPENIPFIYRHFYKHYFRRFAHLATRIATVSEFSKKDICKQYNIEPTKVDVVYNGSNNQFVAATDEQKTTTLAKYSDNCPYFVYVGSLNPRKNIKNLMLAFDMFKKATDSNVKLLVVGEKRWWSAADNNVYQTIHHKADIKFLGRLDDSELNLVMSSSLALVYVSIFEGFGIPIVEAFNSQTAVITSNQTSMPEIAGGAALLANPFSPESISSEMTKLYKDKALRNDLIVKSQLLKDRFTWQKSADLLWESINKATILLQTYP